MEGRVRDSPSALVACCSLQVDFTAVLMILIAESVVARYLLKGLF